MMSMRAPGLRYVEPAVATTVARTRETWAAGARSRSISRLVSRRTSRRGGRTCPGPAAGTAGGRSVPVFIAGIVSKFNRKEYAKLAADRPARFYGCETDFGTTAPACATTRDPTASRDRAASAAEPPRNRVAK